MAAIAPTAAPATTAATATPQLFTNYPLKDIPHPHPHDVLCGRGGGTTAHIGNCHWRMLVAANKELYVSLPKRQKMLLSKSIVNAVRSQNPPGRFLQKDTKTELWFDVGDQRAQEKTSQALREGAPDIRKKGGSGSKKKSVKGGGGGGIGKGKGSADVPGDIVPSDGTAAAALVTAPPLATPASGGFAPSPQMPFISPPSAVTAPLPPTAHLQSPATSGASSGSFSGSPSYGTASVPPPATTYLGSPASSENGVVASANGICSGHTPPQRVDQTDPWQKPAAVEGPADQRCSESADDDDDPFERGVQNVVEPPGALDGQAHVSFGSTGTFSCGPPDGALQLADFSFGDVSVRSHTTAMDDRPVERPQFERNSIPEGEAVVAPVDGGLEPIGFSFGSVLSEEGTRADGVVDRHVESPRVQSRNDDAVQEREELVAPVDGGLEPIGFSFGSVMSEGSGANEISGMRKEGVIPEGEAVVAPVDGGLAPIGFSFGSVMSIGTQPNGRLEAGGLSFGSAMSFAPEAVDGGLEAIGTSFGSMSLVDQQQHKAAPEPSNGVAHSTFPVGSSVPNDPEGTAITQPTFLNSTKSKGSLLDCSDTESEDGDDDEQKSAQASVQKSLDWERMKRAISGATLPAAASFPLPGTFATASGGGPALFDMPAATAAQFERDFSQVDVDDWQTNVVLPEASRSDFDDGGDGRSAADASIMPPPPMKKHGGDGNDDGEDALLATYLNRGNSLTEDKFHR